MLCMRSLRILCENNIVVAVIILKMTRILLKRVGVGVGVGIRFDMLLFGGESREYWT